MQMSRAISETHATHAFTTATQLRAVAIGGTAVAILDAADGVLYAGITAGQNPIQVLQWIASAAVGPSAFEGGLATAGLGAVMHFALSYGFTGAFVVASARARSVRENWPVAGLIWGVIVWAFMNLIVVPMSHATVPPLTFVGLLNGIIGHAVTVGLTAAYVAKRVLRTV